MFFGKQNLLRLTDLPQSSVGAPIPIVLAEEHKLVVLYYPELPKLKCDTPNIFPVDSVTEPETVALVSFQGPYAHQFGPPNDEAIRGHPLFHLGLEPYSSFEVTNSAWIDKLRRRNSVHPYHNDSQFADLRHFIITFHDSTLEVVAKAYTSEVLGCMSALHAASGYFSNRQEAEIL